jgi:hypothetical protein
LDACLLRGGLVGRDGRLERFRGRHGHVVFLARDEFALEQGFEPLLLGACIFELRLVALELRERLFI